MELHASVNDVHLLAPSVCYCRMAAGEFRAMKKLVKLD